MRIRRTVFTMRVIRTILSQVDCQGFYDCAYSPQTCIILQLFANPSHEDEVASKNPSAKCPEGFEAGETTKYLETARVIILSHVPTLPVQSSGIENHPLG